MIFKVNTSMKKFNILLVSCSLAVVFSCAKEEVVDNPQQEDPKTTEEKTEPIVTRPAIRFYSESIETKTAFGTPDEGVYPTLWTDYDDKIKVSGNFTKAVTLDVVPVTPAYTSADFNNQSEDFEDMESPFKFYAFSPSSSSSYTKNNKYWTLTVPASQTPLAGSPQETSQLLMAQSDSYDDYPTSVNLTFNHLTAYGKLTFKNLSLAVGETVSSVTLTAPDNWVGGWKYYIADDGAGNSAGDWVAAGGASTTLVINTTSTSDIWFSCVPRDFTSQTMSVVLSTSLGTYTRNITLPGAFVAGHVASFGVNMSTADFAPHATYNLVTDPDDLTVGSEVIVVAANSDYALGAQNTTYRDQVAITKTGSAINSPSSRVTVFTLGQGYGSNNYYLKNEDDYLNAPGGGNNLGVSDELTSASTWKISIGSPTTISSTNSSDARVNLKYNSTYTRFSCYESGQADVALYKKEGTGTASQIISVISAPTSLNVKMGASDAAVGAITNSSATISYLSSDEEVATVDTDGKITPVAVGDCTITCSVSATGNYIAASTIVPVTVIQETWVDTALGDLKNTDTFVIVGTSGESTYAMKNAVENGSALAVSVTIENSKITNSVTDDLKWALSKDTDGYMFFPTGNSTNKLNISSTGLRISNATSYSKSGTTYNKIQKWNLTSNKLQNFGSSDFYLGINTTETPKWNKYSISTEEEAPYIVTIKFYKRVVE